MVQVSQTELIAGAISGKVVSFPTDTVPALAVKPEQADSIYQLKQRSYNKPLILLGASIENLLPYVVYSSEELSLWQQMTSQYLPGALTLVLPASNKVPQVVNYTDSQTVGIRVPDCLMALEILRQTGVLASSSANISGQDTLVTMNAIEQTFPSVLVLEHSNLSKDKPVGSGLPSTVICWRHKTWQVLRQGSIIV